MHAVRKPHEHGLTAVGHSRKHSCSHGLITASAGVTTSPVMDACSLRKALKSVRQKSTLGAHDA